MDNLDIKLQDIGFRLGLVVAKYEDGRKGAMKAGDISSFTLDRYLTGKTNRISLINIANICYAKNINLNWVLLGDMHNKYLTGDKSNG